MTVLWEKYVALSVETSFFQSLFFSSIKKTQYESHPIFPFSDGFHKLELCIGLNPFFFCSFVSLWGTSLRFLGSIPSLS